MWLYYNQTHNSFVRVVFEVGALWIYSVAVFCFFHNQPLLDKKVPIKEDCFLFVLLLLFWGGLGLPVEGKKKISSIRKNILNQTTGGKKQ